MPEYIIIRTERFIERSSQLIKTYPSLIEFNKFLNYHLQKDPYYFKQESDDYYSLSSSDLQAPELILATGRVAKFPDVKVFYHIDGEQKKVILMSISILS